MFLIHSLLHLQKKIPLSNFSITMPSSLPSHPLSKADKYNLKEKQRLRLSSTANRKIRRAKARLIQKAGTPLSHSNVLTQAAVLFPPSPTQTTMTQGCHSHKYTIPVSKEESLFSKPIPDPTTASTSTSTMSSPSKLLNYPLQNQTTTF